MKAANIGGADGALATREGQCFGSVGGCGAKAALPILYGGSR